jgi:hypothetical protein
VLVWRALVERIGGRGASATVYGGGPQWTGRTGTGAEMGDRTTKGTFAKGNRASRAHGAYSFLALGKLPRGARAIRDSLPKMRRFLEDTVRRAKSGDLAAADAAMVHTAVLCEGERRLWWYLARLVTVWTPTSSPATWPGPG